MSTEPDLGRDPIAVARSKELLDRISDRRDSSTFALVGEWGSGKTWLLESILGHLQKHERWPSTRCTIVRFNPWYYADEQALFAGFSALLIQQTLRKGRARTKLAKLLNAVGPSAKYGGIDVSGVVRQLGDALDSTSPSQIRKRVDEGLAKTGRQVLIVMDDLDRLTTDELLILFKLVRLVGDIPGLHYLLAYDEDTLHHLLKQAAVAAGSTERARRYLEKIVERRWEVPPLTEKQLDELLFNRIPLVEGDSSDQGIGYRLEGIVSRAITTPRAAERFVQLANAVSPEVRQELHQGDLYLALFLRAMAPRLWALIVEQREFLTGGRPLLLEEGRKAKASGLLDRMTVIASELPFGADLLDLVEESFPAFTAALNPQYLRSPVAPRIGHPDFVEHYLWLDLPPGAISEVAVVDALRRLPDPQAEQHLRERMAASPRLLLDSVWRHATDEGVEKVQVVRLLERLYRDHEIDATFGIFSVSVDRRLFSIANDLLKQMSVDELEALAVDEDTPAGRELLTELVARLKVRPEVGADDLMSFVTRAAPSFAAALAAQLTTAASSAFAIPARRRDLINLIELDRERAQSLVVDQLNAGMWREDDLLSAYLVAMIGPSGNRWHLDLDRMRSDLGSELADRFVATVSSQLTPSDAILTEVPAGEEEPSIEQRRSLTAFLLSRGESARDDDE